MNVAPASFRHPQSSTPTKARQRQSWTISNPGQSKRVFQAFEYSSMVVTANKWMGDMLHFLPDLHTRLMQIWRQKNQSINSQKPLNSFHLKNADPGRLTRGQKARGGSNGLLTKEVLAAAPSLRAVAGGRIGHTTTQREQLDGPTYEGKVI